MMSESSNVEVTASSSGFSFGTSKSNFDEEEASPGTWCYLSRKVRAALGLLFVALLVIALSIYFQTRPETVQVVETMELETLPSLIKVAPIGAAGAILIEYTELLEDNSTIFYYLSIQDVNSTILESATNFDSVALYLTRSLNPTIEDLSIAEDRNNGRALSTNETVLRIGLLNNLTSPFRLPDFFLPGNFNGAILVEENREEDSVSIVEVTRASFSVIVDAERNISTTVTPSISPSLKPTLQPPPEPTAQPTISRQPSIRGATVSPTKSPTSSPSDKPSGLPSPTRLPTQPPTRSPTKRPTAEPTGHSLFPPILTAQVSGSYNIDAMITIDYVQGFENGQVVNRPRLQCDIPNLSNAPGPYLYLSKRPYSETRRRDLEDEDILIRIDSGNNGQFNVKGRFEQYLDELGSVHDLEDYTNGSWIVWCRPFGVWIGGGSISAS